MPPTTHAHSRAYAPYPHPASFLSLLSVIFSLSIFALSLLNYSMLALFLNAAATGLALAYHTIVGINNFLEARQRSSQPPSISIGTGIVVRKLSTSFSLKATVLCAFVCAAWIVAFVVSTQLAIQGPVASTKPLPHAGLWNSGIQIAIACLDGLEFVVMVAYLRMCMVERMRYDERILHPLCRIPLPLSAEKDLEYGANFKDISLDSKDSIAPQTVQLPSRAKCKFSKPTGTTTTTPNWDFITPDLPKTPLSSSFRSIVSVNALWN